jgi:hypothetical protein
MNTWTILYTSIGSYKCEVDALFLDMKKTEKTSLTCVLEIPLQILLWLLRDNGSHTASKLLRDALLLLPPYGFLGCILWNDQNVPVCDLYYGHPPKHPIIITFVT